VISLFNTQIKTSEADDVYSVLDSGKLVMGPHVEALEHELAAFYANDGAFVTCASGTDALTLCLEELDCRDAVIVPAMTFSATYEAVLRAGATPIVVDIDQETGTPSSLQVQSAIMHAIEDGYRVCAVIMVHLYGWPAYDLIEIARLCDLQDIHLIEDCAQCFGASLDSRMLGTWGNAAAFSFYPTKPLGGIGDGGAAYFPSLPMAKRARARRNHGRTEDGQMYPGYNSRLDETNAIVLRNRLSRYGRSFDCRRELSLRYHAGGLAKLSFKRNGRGVPYVYPILVDNREAVRFRLADIGV